MYKLRSLNLAKFGFPRVISYKDGPEGSEILMEQLGVSLNAESYQNRKRFTKEHAYDITLQLLDRIETLHSIGYLHGDIKLENMVYGGPVGSPHYNRVYLIDFGLCSKYLLNNGKHIEKVTT